MHRFFLSSIILVLLLNCNNAKNPPEVDNSPVSIEDTNKTNQFEMENISEDSGCPDTNDIATYYILVIDTNQLYAPLQNQMYELKNIYQWPIDTMNRYYNTTMNKIVLPKNYEDEMYAGDYYPRNMVSDFLSIEYMEIYKQDTRMKNMCLIGGIFKNQLEADQKLQRIKTSAKKAFILKSQVYVGCMH